MTATFTPTGGSLITLAGADANMVDQPTGLEGTATPVVETHNIVRADAPVRYHRGNVLHTRTFEVSKSYATHEDAMTANEELAATLSENLGTFRLKNAAGSTILELTSASVAMRFDAKAGSVARRVFTVEGVA